MQTNEVKCCLECATRGGIFQEIGNDWPMCPCCKTVAPATIKPRQWDETRDQFIARAMESQRAFDAALIESAPVELEAPKKTRCAHYGIIREFAAIAREMGCDMKAQDRARGAMGVYLGVKIESRAQLTAAQWSNAITGLRAGVLFW